MQIHKHTATCRKGIYGKIHCRLAFDRPLSDETRVVWIDLKMGIDGKEQVVPITDPIPPPSTNIARNAIFKEKDSRWLVYEIKRPNREDGRFSECSQALSNAVASNTSVSLLGSTSQAKPAVMYMVKYVTKDAIELTASLSLIHEAIQTVEKYPSVAENSGTTIRTGQHILTRILNNITGSCEVRGSVVVLLLLSILSNIGFTHT